MKRQLALYTFTSSDSSLTYYVAALNMEGARNRLRECIEKKWVGRTPEKKREYTEEEFLAVKGRVRRLSSCATCEYTGG